jgi:hypothetical protein
VARTWILYRCMPCHPWCTHRTFLVVKNLLKFSSGCEQFHEGRSFGFLVINICNHGEQNETPCVIDTTAVGLDFQAFFPNVSSVLFYSYGCYCFYVCCF